MSHEIVKCSCGAVIAQCRCFSPAKSVRIVESGCTSCNAPSPTTTIEELESRIAPQADAGFMEITAH